MITILQCQALVGALVPVLSLVAPDFRMHCVSLSSGRSSGIRRAV